LFLLAFCISGFCSSGVVGSHYVIDSATKTCAFQPFRITSAGQRNDADEDAVISCWTCI